MFKKIGRIWNEFVSTSNGGDEMKEETLSHAMGEQEALYRLRMELVSTIARNADASDVIKSIVESDGDLQSKYALLDVKWLIGLNNQDIKSLVNIVQGLSMISKYAKFLLKNKDHYKTIPMSNSHFQNKILPLNGSSKLLEILGYSDRTQTALSFPPNTDVNVEVITNLLADMMLFKVEMKYYLSGSHKNPQHLDALLPTEILNQLQEDGGGVVAGILETSMSSISSFDSENIKAKSGSSGESSPIYYSANSNNSSKKSSTEITTVNDEMCSPVAKIRDENGQKDENFHTSELGMKETEKCDSSSLKTLSNGAKLSCSLCCNEEAQTVCKSCSNKLLCDNCDQTWHSHPTRRSHVTQKISEMDLSTMMLEENIMGPYGIIAQNNDAALIAKKQKAALNKAEQGRTAHVGDNKTAHDGDDKTAHDGEASPDATSKTGNMPDFGSIMSNPEGLSRSPVNRPILQARGVSDGENISTTQKMGVMTTCSQKSFVQPQNNSHMSESNQHPYSLHPQTFHYQGNEMSMMGSQMHQSQRQQPHLSHHYPHPSQGPQQRSEHQGRPDYRGYPYRVNTTEYHSQLSYPPPLNREHPLTLQMPYNANSSGSNTPYYSPNQSPNSFTQPAFTPSPGHNVLPNTIGQPRLNFPQYSGTLPNQDTAYNYDQTPGTFRPNTFNKDLAHEQSEKNPALFNFNDAKAFQEFGKQEELSQENVHGTTKPNYAFTPNNAPQRNLFYTQQYYHSHQPNTPPYYVLPKQSMPQQQLGMIPDNSNVSNRYGHNQSIRPIMSSSTTAPILRSSSNNNAPTSAAAKIIKRILSQELKSEQQLLCQFRIDELDDEIKECETEINDLLLADKDESEIMKKKKELLKTRKELKEFFTNIDTQESKDSDFKVYYPPKADSVKKQTDFVTEMKQKSLLKECTQMIRNGKLDTTTNYGNTSTPGIAGKVQSGNSPALTSIQDDATTKQQFQKHQNELPVQTMIQSNELLRDQSCSVSPSLSNPPVVKHDIGRRKSSRKHYMLKWKCSHCTFLNDGNLHACAVCNKTTKSKEYTEEEIQGEVSDGEDLDHQTLVMKGPIQSGNDVVWQHKEVNSIKEQRQIEMQKEEERILALKREEQKKYEAKQGGNEFLAEDPHKLKKLASCQNSNLGGSENEHIKVNALGKLRTSPLSSLSSHLERLNLAQACDQLKKEGDLLIRTVKDANILGYPVDAVPIALSLFNPELMTVIEWLNLYWKKNLNKIIKQSRDIGSSKEQNSVGRLTLEEAEAAYIKSKGNLKTAVDLCVKQREELFEQLSTTDTYAREEILKVMFTQRGDKEKAEQELVRLKLQSFIDRIWNDTGSNDSSNVLQNNWCHDMAHVPGGDDGIICSPLRLDSFQETIRDTGIDRDRRIRMILVEGKLKSWGRAEIAIDFLDKENLSDTVSLSDILEAVHNCVDRKNALSFLNHECVTCFEIFPMGKIRNLNCQCKLCTECLLNHLTVVIKEKHVRHWTCPMCDLPDVEDECFMDHLSMLQLMLKTIASPELLNLFEDRVRDFSLQRDPLFRWCAHCGNGFLAGENMAGAMAMACQMCRKKTCFTCKRMWEDQHTGLTCEEFEQWKFENDPNNQAIGLAKHLEVNGIECPKCKRRYALAKGGCMHFKCPECGHEFCSGCYESFYKAGVCKKYKACGPLGFHCHHPRDCFSFLRDNNVEELQRLLGSHNIAFNIQVPEDQVDKQHCPVMEQKDEGVAKKDEMCGKDVLNDMAGLCEAHYKEYLTGLINRHALDPVYLMEVDDMTRLLRRFDVDMPSREPVVNDQNFKGQLITFVQEKLPLNRKKH